VGKNRKKGGRKVEKRKELNLINFGWLLGRLVLLGSLILLPLALEAAYMLVDFWTIPCSWNGDREQEPEGSILKASWIRMEE
jgi:cytochrome c-type biogenesis protein CcmH/NrfG